MRVIFVNRYFHPDQSATSRMVSALAFGLARYGTEVTVIASRSRHDDPQSVLAADETVSGVNVFRLATSRFGRHTLPGRAVDYLSFHLTAFLWLLHHARRGDMVVVCTDPPLISLACGLPVRLRGGQMINWIMDLFPETAVELGLFRKAPILGRLAAYLRDRSIVRSRLSICPTERMADFLRQRGVPADRIKVLHHWSDATEIRPVARERNALRAAWNYGEKFVVGYSGNFGRAHEFATLIDAATLLQDRADIAFLMVGGGYKLGSVMAAAQERGLANVAFKPLQPAERIAESLGVPDIHVVSLLPHLEHCIIPSKFYGILAAGRPTLFIGDPKGSVAAVIDAQGCGVTAAIGDPERLAGVIEALAATPERVAAMGVKARAVLEADYAYDRALITWRKLFHALAEEGTLPARSRILEEEPS
ncbi:glycosyltransferase family 4 protein [Shinella sp. JR1-6]|uniref:glycosyltransferase family 4 protein n=1 Tax=Shinella sp. JR1-6 TaxID=2527671 RepID=UPI00102D4338|nr:glycosyltransferase family 4 protein [Shinella sp. JR1-6]TAA55817.1 glycosyltransferase WbuB [Shinella sp. JR1-6]